jgi:predicted nucleotidyltransferase
MAHSGRFLLRVKPSTHGHLAQEAKRRGISLNRLCAEALQRGLETHPTESSHFDFLSPVVSLLRAHFGKNLVAVLVFGSRVTGKATATSDLDLLVVLEDGVPLTRSLYSWWDESVDSLGRASERIDLPANPLVNPQFVHLPENPEEAGGLWLEVATASEVLWEGRGRITKALDGLRNLIAQDRFRRYWSNGIPYWVRS